MLDCPGSRQDLYKEVVIGQTADPLLAAFSDLQDCLMVNLQLVYSQAAVQASRVFAADFGHELITAVHTPIVWSDRRPTDKEFRESFSATKLSAQKILDFMRQRQSVIQKVVLTNSEGYWSGELLFFCLPIVLHRVSLGCSLDCNAPFGIAAAVIKNPPGATHIALDQTL